MCHNLQKKPRDEAPDIKRLHKASVERWAKLYQALATGLEPVSDDKPTEETKPR